MTEPNPNSAEHSTISAPPQNWQLMDAVQMVEMLMELFDNQRDEAQNHLKREHSKLVRLSKSGHAHNKRMVEKKISQIEKSMKLLLGVG
ncbi:MAG: hypothetical protein HQM11_06465 [SAR324 cluster bacterium]|nr:hypothetical protein [SAR324 cluster bacterium]